MIIDDNKSSLHTSESRSPRSTFDGARRALSNESTRSGFIGLDDFEASDESEGVGGTQLPLYSPRGRMPPHAAGGSPSHPQMKTNVLPTYESALAATAAFQDDGRLDVTFSSKLRRQPEIRRPTIHDIELDESVFLDAPPMNVNIMIVGSRGDVQPYLALGQRLQQHGHKVRLATHETFREFVNDAGLRFFNIGGNPHELMSYMVRNPGLIPGFESLRNGDVGKKQKMVAEILDGCWRSCYEPDNVSEGGAVFSADAIISNPPAFAHIHCAEALGIPLHMSFTMPWCATSAFPHPLVNIKQGDAERTLANYYSYGLIDMMTWQGLGHTINKFRMKRLGLPYLSTASAMNMLDRAGVPWTYCLSSALVPKPDDWMAHIDIVGFYFLDLAKTYTPPRDLEGFLNSGEPPIYIGFGSIVLEDSQQITKSVLGAISLAGVRAVVSTGWGGLDPDMMKAAGPDVFALGNVPHDWLFERVSAVCHHGGAGTTAIGLKFGKPTIVVPFFGDQAWWAAQIARRGAGPPPIHPKQLTEETLAGAISIALSNTAQDAAQVVGEMIRQEDGTKNGVDSFHRHLPMLKMRCELDPKRIAVWYWPTRKLRLSAFAAQILAEGGEADINQLELYRACEYDTSLQATDPITGTVAPFLHALNDVGRGIVKLPTMRPDKGIVKLLVAVPKCAQGTLKGAQEGFQNLPKIYGGEVRESRKVTGIGSGLVEGGKSLAFGVYDGVTDLVREPVRGYKDNGIVGAVAGVGVGALNVLMKPAAGILGTCAHPMEGALKSMQSLFHKQVGKERRATRYREGLMEARNCSQAERQTIINAFRIFQEKSRRELKGKGKAE